jgi:hypothetical protein
MAAVGLQHLTALRSLHLELELGTGSSSWHDLEAAAVQLHTCEAAAAQGLGHLTTLTHVTLGGVYASEAVLGQVSSLRHLRELQLLRPECDITLEGCEDGGALQLQLQWASMLPDGLTTLSVDGSCLEVCA